MTVILGLFRVLAFLVGLLLFGGGAQVIVMGDGSFEGELTTEGWAFVWTVTAVGLALMVWAVWSAVRRAEPR